MNADELDAAREAVSATKTWRDQMRADWGTSFREPEEVLDEAVGELLAERDRLRTVVDAVRGYMPLTELPAIEVDEQERLALWLEVRRQLRQLDVSPDTGADT